MMKVTKKDYQLVFLFSGQGSHYRGMGEKLYKTNPVFTNTLEKSDSYMQKVLGRSLIEELYYKKDADFDDLLITHPAIVAVELALCLALRAEGVVPDYVSGNSLGEFAAAAICGVWSAEKALEAAQIQAKSIVRNNEKGGMLAILDIAPDLLQRLSKSYNLYIASNNFPGHYTLSGATAYLDAVEVELKSLEIPYMRLPVAYPFHSPLLKAGKVEFQQYMSTLESLDQPTKGFISGLYAKELSSLPNDYFWEVVSQPADFGHVVAALEKKAPCLYVDLGPSGTSATFMKYNLEERSNSVAHSIMTPFKQEDKQLQKLFQLLES
ncbi:MAG: acyltransferase domain-containing protein [Bacteroidota bacterium]